MKLDDFTYDEHGNVIPKSRPELKASESAAKPSGSPPEGNKPKSIWREPTRPRRTPKPALPTRVPTAVWIAGGVVAAVVLLGVCIATLGSSSGSRHAPHSAATTTSAHQSGKPVRLVATPASLHENGGRLEKWEVSTNDDPIFDKVLICREPSNEGGVANLILRQRGHEAPEVYLAASYGIFNFDTDYPAIIRFDKDEPVQFRASQGSAGSAFMPWPEDFLRYASTAHQVVFRLPEKGGNTLTLTFELDAIHAAISAGDAL